MSCDLRSCATCEYNKVPSTAEPCYSCLMQPDAVNYTRHVVRDPDGFPVLPDPKPEPKPEPEKQVGGDHYVQCGMQPKEFILANNLGYFEGAVVKYVARYRSKGGKQDLEKAIHCLEILLDQHYPEGK